IDDSDLIDGDLAHVLGHGISLVAGALVIGLRLEPSLDLDGPGHAENVTDGRLASTESGDDLIEFPVEDDAVDLPGRRLEGHDHEAALPLRVPAHLDRS